ncbi:MAG: hypothetical protein MPJ50_01125 [Pirellulales bacterium]|nr:hypothetical protein [Pirellulales bacterium]
MSSIRAAVAIGLLLAFAFLTHAPATAQVRGVDVEAFVGEPYGVAKIVVRFAPNTMDKDVLRFWIEERNDRVHYPTYGNPPLRRLVRNLFDLRPEQATAYFLFKGGQPFSVRLFAGQPIDVQVRPRFAPLRRARLLDEWWQQMRAGAGLLDSSDTDYPQQIDNYLASLLSLRLNLPWRDRPQGPLANLFGDSSMDRTLGPFLGTEEQRITIERDIILGKYVNASPASLPLPPHQPSPALAFPPFPGAEPNVEPMAMYVPRECFYVRTGSFGNFIWLRKLIDRTGGDMRNLIAVRGLDYQTDARMQTRLGLRDSKLSAVLGPLVVSDVALIGLDSFVREGASMGLVFEARNSFLFATEMNSQRQTIQEETPSATLEEVTIGDKTVTLLSTPDHRVRSFYVANGDYHLVTSSRKLVERFLEVHGTSDALGATAEFKNTRWYLPLDRQDTIFAYMSDAFFENHATPQYRIETMRRLRATAEIELWRIAELVAKREGQPSGSIRELVQGGYLPPGFGTLPDGSQTVREGDRFVNTRRGSRGYFVPAADVEIESITPLEAQEYNQFLTEFRSSTGRVNPIAFGLRRFASGTPTPEGEIPIERVEIDAFITPFTQSNSWISQLGAPDGWRLQPLPGDLVSAELVLGDRHWFAGLRDLNPLPSPWQGANGSEPQSLFAYLLKFLFGSPGEYIVGYLGATPAVPAGPLFTPWGNSPQFGPPDAGGYAQGGPVWRRDYGDYSMFSFDRGLIEQISPQVLLVPAERPAQGRLHIGDPRQTAVAELLDLLGLMQASRTSDANTRFLDVLSRQLAVPDDQAIAIAEELLDAKMVCTLGGQYEPNPDAFGHPTWRTSLSAQSALPDYRFPPLQWFRGLDLDFAIVGDVLSAHATVDLQLIDEPGVPPLPAEIPPEVIPALIRGAEELPPPPDRSRGGKGDGTQTPPSQRNSGGGKSGGRQNH